MAEITREITGLRGKNKGKRSAERVISICSIRPDPSRGDELLAQLRQPTFKDFHNDMNRFNQRLAFATITSPCP